MDIIGADIITLLGIIFIVFFLVATSIINISDRND